MSRIRHGTVLRLVSPLAPSSFAFRRRLLWLAWKHDRGSGGGRQVNLTYLGRTKGLTRFRLGLAAAAYCLIVDNMRWLFLIIAAAPFMLYLMR
jgi:hypothetical protein